MQVYDKTEDGRQCANLYRLHLLPAIIMIDPRTREKVAASLSPPHTLHVLQWPFSVDTDHLAAMLFDHRCGHYHVTA